MCTNTDSAVAFLYCILQGMALWRAVQKIGKRSEDFGQGVTGRGWGGGRARGCLAAWCIRLGGGGNQNSSMGELGGSEQQYHVCLWAQHISQTKLFSCMITILPLMVVQVRGVGQPSWKSMAPLAALQHDLCSLPSTDR